MPKIIDSHFHISRQKDQPWLVGPMVPRIFGPYEPIRGDYPIEEFLADQEGSGVEKGIYVQTNWAKEDFEKEVAFVSETAIRTGWPHAIVGYADMTADDVDPSSTDWQSTHVCAACACSFIGMTRRLSVSRRRRTSLSTPRCGQMCAD